MSPQFKRAGVVGAVLLVLLIGAAWMWRQPAGSAEPAASTPETAAAARERGRSMREGFMATHRRSGPGGARRAQTDDTGQ